MLKWLENEQQSLGSYVVSQTINSNAALISLVL